MRIPLRLYRTLLCSASSAAFLAFIQAVPAYAQAQTFQFDLQSQNMGDTLKAVASVTRQQIAFDPSITHGKTAPALIGNYSIREALERLTLNSGLDVTKGHSGLFIVKQADLKTGETEAGNAAAVYESAEIIVTAQKREERLQDVPQSISVLTKGEIDRRGLTNMDDFMRSVPGVSRLETGAGRSNPIVIRGIAATPETDSTAVGVYFGEAPLVFTSLSGDYFGSPDLALVDIERIEVLKGPQATLYGAGSMAGVVRNVPASPNLKDIEASVTAGYSHTARYGGANYLMHGVLNLPIIEDKLAVRLVAYRFDDSGYMKNVAATAGAGLPPFVASSVASGATVIDETGVGGTTRDGARIGVLWQPTDTFKAAYTFAIQDTAQHGVLENHLTLPAYQQGYINLGPTLPDGAGQDTRTILNNLVLTYNLPWVQIFSSTSKLHTRSEFRRDVSIAGIGPLNQIENSKYDMLTEEVRLTSSFDGPIQFLAGGYYENYKSSGSGLNFWAGDATSFPFQSPEALAFYPQVTTGPVGAKLKQKAIFGEISYEPLEGLKATVGGRRFSYRTTTHRYSTYLPGFGLTTQGFIGDIAFHEKGNVFKAAVSYKITPNNMVYGQWSQGFRLGSPAVPLTFGSICDPDGNGRVEITLPNGQTISSAGDVKSDRTDNYEVGGKFALGRKARFNVAAYQINWDKIPVTVFNSTAICSISANAGRARSRGFEAELQFDLMNSLTSQVGVSYVDAKLSEDAGSLGNKGDRLPGSPKFTANAAMTYNFTALDRDAYFRTDYLYVGKFYNNLQQAGRAIGGYQQINFRSGVSVSDSVNLEFYVNNVTASKGITWIFTTLADGRGYRLRPRTFGAQMTVRF